MSQHPPEPPMGQDGQRQPAPPPPKKRRTGLIVGGAAGAIVFVAAIVLVVVILTRPPTLTPSEFELMYAKGDSLLGDTVDERGTTPPTYTEADDRCAQTVVNSLRAGKDWFSASAGPRAAVAGARFKDPNTAATQYDALDDACSGQRTDSGTVNGARYQIVTKDGADVLVVQLGNVIVMGSTSKDKPVGARDFADEIAKEIRTSAN